MLEVFKKYINDKVSMSEDDLNEILSYAILKKMRRRQFLLQEGDVWRYNAFVCSGFLRKYSVDDKGTEHIMSFSPENYWTGDRESLVNDTPSKFNIEALENAEILLFKKEDFEMLCTKIPVFNNMINNILHRSFISSQSRIHSSISLTSEEKYNNFVLKFPSIVNRVPQHMIASYIGISPETLSRIRSQANKK
ncbi:Crp/Fnr family transcriptional regulator [Mariniflexile litorale]|uniref:Crp/Fnr family transcriptional regulator n=1 Tax=Mariniflexile litorale TaxID=3045158 RepID=A0AAU7EDB4_9FLAO|nr:Crp/Fnr family transcriptional regulator [Mariniflexile sp. KMM 9835]MDQ8213036.1 Crp/Fnr family transcriptional regulator [Mariniflexile sp. KMM 9835]